MSVCACCGCGVRKLLRQAWCHWHISSCVPFTFLSPASSKVSGVVLNCINMQEFIDCLPWHFCREGKRVLQSPSALITGSWQCYLSLVKDKPRHRTVTRRAEGAHLLGSLQQEGCLRGIFTLICLMCREPWLPWKKKISAGNINKLNDFVQLPSSGAQREKLTGFAPDFTDSCTFTQTVTVKYISIYLLLISVET